MSTYRNPIVRGFYPDPSIVRVGDDYYMVNSSFQYFPAIPIHHSKDLVHWELIGHVITENDYLPLNETSDSHGIWAPDISYFNGEFYVFATMRLNDPPENNTGKLRQTLFMKSKNPEGPYSKPVVLDIDCIDPSHFVDDDGTHYCVTAPGITITKLTDDCEAIAEPTTLVWPGTGLRCAEGPHILKKDGWYYAILAEGGTGFGHQISVGRAKNVMGPYESSPHNPALKQTDPGAEIQRSGHGDLVLTQTGEWWVTYLCGRMNEGRCTTLGRETSLDKVTWTEDGWFIVNEGKGPSVENEAPAGLPWTEYEEKNFDDFDDDKLSLEWEFVRNPRNDKISLTKNKGYFTIEAGEYDLCERKSYNTLVRRETELSYTFSTKLEFEPFASGQQAGITCYYGINNYIKCCMTYDDGLKIRVYENRNSEKSVMGEVSIKEGTKTVYLKVRVIKQTREFFYSLDNETWILVGRAERCYFLCDEGVIVGKHHTGTFVGIYAYNGGNEKTVDAKFDWVDYKA